MIPEAGHSSDYRFPKEKKLRHRSLVEGLFRLGKSFYEFPFRVSWRLLSEEELHRNFRNCMPPGISKLQMMVTVPKKKRRHAVDRVLMRRRIREAFRLSYFPLLEEVNTITGIGTLSIAFVYVHTENMPYIKVKEKMEEAVAKLSKKIKIKETTAICQDS